MTKIAGKLDDVAELEAQREKERLLFLQKGESQHLTDAQKIEAIRYHFECIMLTLGLDLTDDSLRGTPRRVANMYVKEIFSGLDPRNHPKISVFENSYGYNQMLLEKNITVFSYCERHFVPIIGKAHVAYFPDKKVIGLSKINRLVRYFSNRPQIQERLTVEIAEGLKSVLQTSDVAVYIKANHLCISSRGIQDTNSSVISTYFGGRFEKQERRDEFLENISH